MNLPTLDTADMALRVAVRQGAREWLLWQTPDGKAEEFAQDLVSAFAEIEGKPACHVHAASAAEFIEAVGRPGDDVLVVSGVSALNDEAWAIIDRMRSRLHRQQCVVLVADEASVARLAAYAPNLASFIGGSIWRWHDDTQSLTTDDKQRRLEGLRAWSGFTDDEVMALARSGELPGDPEYAEWLVLLDRGGYLTVKGDE